jgi:hypothetical protein
MIESYEKRGRAVKLAITYLRKAESWLYPHPPLPHDPAYWTLLDQGIETATEIVRALPGSFFCDERVEDTFGMLGGGTHTLNLSDSVLEQAKKLVSEIEGRRERGDALRRIGQLEDTTGRTPEEAKAYLAKASELRERHGLAAAS